MIEKIQNKLIDAAVDYVYQKLFDGDIECKNVVSFVAGLETKMKEIQ